VAYSPDGRLIAAAPFGGGLVIHDAGSGRPRLTIKPHHEWFVRMAFSPDGQHLAAIGSHKAVKIYDVRTGELRLRLEGHTQQCFGIAYTPDGARLATAGGTARPGSGIHTMGDCSTVWSRAWAPCTGWNFSDRTRCFCGAILLKSVPGI
jgi:WD40 repeat protein